MTEHRRSRGVRIAGGGATLVMFMSAWLYVGREGPSQASAAPVAASADREVTDAPDDDFAFCGNLFARPFRELTGTAMEASADRASVDAPKAVKWHKSLNALRESLVDRIAEAKTRIEVLIVTLPDPIDSGLGYQFDVQLQALQYGIEASPTSAPKLAHADPQFGMLATEWIPAIYNRDRSWLPWDERERDEVKRKRTHACRLHFPGVMLFRSSDVDDPSVLVALLVGETPTAGLNREAMNAALDADLILRTNSSEPTRILGPTFSSSALALRHALQRRECAGQCPDVDVISATANGPQVPGLLGFDWTNHRGTSNVHFQTTTLAEERLTCAYLHFVRRLGVGDGLGDDEDDGASGARAQALDGVAVLQELGTEFGGSERHTRLGGVAAQATQSCRYRPERYLSFPFHISRIRDEYEKYDKAGAPTNQDLAIARHTSLPVSLREPELPLDLQQQRSPEKTTNAQDVALSHVLGAISREGIRYVGIESTDIGDAIFLARKIRDVAPDVRIAFFSADALLLHSSFQRDLLGSLVVSPYPFLGAADFTSPTPVGQAQASRRHTPFENDHAEATYNAALALRGADVAALSEYDFIGKNDCESSQVALPVWVSAIGRKAITPLHVRQSRDDHQAVYKRWRTSELLRHGCVKMTTPAGGNLLTGMQLHLDNDVTPPRLWQFVLAIAALIAFIDHRTLVRRRLRFEAAAIPSPGRPIADRTLDLALSRLKWDQLAWIRGTALTVIMLNLISGTWLAMFTYRIAGLSFAVAVTWSVGLVASVVFVSLLYATGRAGLRFFREMQALGRLCRSWPEINNRSDKLLSKLVTATVGFESSVGLKDIVYTSFARLRLGSGAAFLVTLAILVCMALNMGGTNDLSTAISAASITSTLFTLRNLALLDGLSSSTPLLLAFLCIYVACVAAMQRVAYIYELSRMTPDDGIQDGAATPITSILFPGAEERGFGHHERALTNPILRLNALSRYVTLTVTIVVIPCVLYFLKPPAALEPRATARFLFGILMVCGYITSLTAVQFYEHWRALLTILELLEALPNAEAFGRVHSLLRSRLSGMTSPASNDLAQFAACATDFAELAGNDAQGLGRQAKLLRERCCDALAEQARRRGSAEAASAEAKAGRELIRSAQNLSEVLCCHVSAGFSADWRNRASAYVASVITLLLRRHLRQARPFIWGTTSCALLLLAAITSYPFEPHRALLTGAGLLTVVVIGVSMTAYITLDRNNLIHYIAHTKAGPLQIDGEFLKNVFALAVLPMLVVVAAQYPKIGEMLAPLLDPITRVLR